MKKKFDNINYREGAEKFYDLFREKEDGPFYIDLAHVPELKKDSGWFVQRKRLDDHKIVIRTGYHSMDPEKRLMSLNLWYELFEDGKMVKRYFEGAETYVHTPEGIRELLKDTGYETLAWYGGHEKQEFTDKSGMMVIVARST